MATTSAQISVDNNASTRDLATLNRALLLVSLPFGVLNFVLPVYGKQIGASAVEIGLLFSVFSLMTVVLRPLVGAGLDRYGRRGFFIAGLAAYGLSMVAFAFSAALAGLIIARVLQGIASSLLWLAVNAIVADLAKAARRGVAFGHASQSSNQGAMIGTFICFSVLIPLGFESGWQPLFIGYAAVGGLAVLLAWQRMPETRPAALDKQDAGLADGLRHILRTRSLVIMMLFGMVTAASSSMLSPILMVFLQEKFPVELEVLGMAFIPMALVWALLPSRLGKLSDRFGRKPLMVLAMFIAAIVSFLIPNMGSLAALSILWAVEAVCFAASDPASQALVTDLTGEDQRGRIFGIYALAGSLGAVIGPLAGGWFYDAYGQVVPFMINAGILALSAITLWLLLEKK